MSLFYGVCSPLLLFLCVNVFKLKPFSRPHLPLHKYIYFSYSTLVFARNLPGKGKRRLVAKSYSNLRKTSVRKTFNWKWKVGIVLNLKSHIVPSVLIKFPLSLLDISSHHRAEKFSWHWRTVMTSEMNRRKKFSMILNDVIISSHLL